MTRSGDRASPASLRSDSNALRIDRPVKISFDMAPPAGGWRTSGRLRVQSKTLFGERQVIARFNGVLLEATSDVSEPYRKLYPDGLGAAETLRAWNVPQSLLMNGVNAIEIKMTRGAPLVLSFVDLAVR
jgi:hypothetical protein